MIYNVTVLDRLMPLSVKAMYTANTHNVLTDSSLSDVNVLKRFGIMNDTQAIDVVTFDFKGTGVRYGVCGTIDYQMNFLLLSVHICNDNTLHGIRAYM